MEISWIVSTTQQQGRNVCVKAVDAGHDHAPIHHSGKYYKDMPLFLESDNPLQKKIYRKDSNKKQQQQLNLFNDNYCDCAFSSIVFLFLYGHLVIHLVSSDQLK